MNEKQILIGANTAGEQIFLNPKMANRHGLIAGATGTGKTVTLQILAEAFSKMGVPVFTADVKGDLSGISQPGSEHEKVTERINKIKIEDFNFSNFPTVFWDLYCQQGHPVRTTISEMGPVLLSRLLDLNDTQEGVLHIAFKYADDQKLLLLDLKDLQELLRWLAENKEELKKDYGNVHPSSVAAIQRDLLVLEQSGAELFFGEKAIDLKHLMQTDFSGNGVISILDATKLLTNSKLYSTFLLWLMSELFENLPEVGDPEKPKLIFFFDEAHLLFDDAPKALIEKIQTVVRLIRSKGVGIYFVTQNPADIPDEVLGQLGNRIQHALRAYTPADQKKLKAAANSFRPNPAFDTKETISNLDIGEALVSVLDDQGAPTPVEQTLIRPPASRIGPVSNEERKAVMDRSPLKDIYDKAEDRESAYEILQKRFEELAKQEKGSSKKDSVIISFFKSMFRSLGSAIGRIAIGGAIAAILGKKVSASKKSSSTSGQILKSVGRSMKYSVSRKIGNKISRGILDTILKK